MELKDLRAAIKQVGFKARTKRLSYGIHLTYVHIESGEALTYNVFTSEQVKRWQPLFDCLDKLPFKGVTSNGEKVYGHTS